MNFDVFYNLLRQRLDIRQLLIELGVEVENNHGNLYALCPFHNDSHPSWSIQSDNEHPAWGKWRCFGCNRTGNICSLVRDLSDYNYTQSLNYLMQKCGISISGNELSDYVLDSKLTKNEKIKQITEPTLSDFSPVIEGSDEWNYLAKRGVKFGQIIRTGVLAGTGYYSNRVIFPIRDCHFSIRSFYARSILQNPQKKGLLAKGFSINDVMWGMERTDLMNDRAYVVEGIFDALAVERCLIRIGQPPNNIYAALKSSISEGQAQFLRNFRKVVGIPDQKGGGDGLLPSMKRFLRNQDLRMVELDAGEDPDSQELKGGLGELILKSKSVYETKIRFYVDYGLPGR